MLVRASGGDVRFWHIADSFCAEQNVCFRGVKRTSICYCFRGSTPDFGPVYRVSCDAQDLSCVASSSRVPSQMAETRPWATLVPARPLAAALVIETTLMPFGR